MLVVPGLVVVERTGGAKEEGGSSHGQTDYRFVFTPSMKRNKHAHTHTHTHTHTRTHRTSTEA